MSQVAREKLEKIVGHVSQLSVKHWLKTKGLEYSAGNTNEFYDRLEKLILNKKLTVEGLQQAALEIEENGGKRVYLRELLGSPLPKDKKKLEKHLRDQHIDLADQPTNSIKTPRVPTLNYVWWSQEQIRIK